MHSDECVVYKSGCGVSGSQYMQCPRAAFPADTPLAVVESCVALTLYLCVRRLMRDKSSPYIRCEFLMNKSW